MIAHLPSMEDTAAPAYFEAASAGAARVAADELMAQDDDTHTDTHGAGSDSSSGDEGAESMSGSEDEVRTHTHTRARAAHAHTYTVGGSAYLSQGVVCSIHCARKWEHVPCVHATLCICVCECVSQDAMDADDEYGAPAKRQRGVLTHGNAQSAALYDEAGQYNPHRARQLKKQMKKNAVKAEAPPKGELSGYASRTAVCMSLPSPARRTLSNATCKCALCVAVCERPLALNAWLCALGYSIVSYVCVCVCVCRC